jgi:hypothetical protein
MSNELENKKLYSRDYYRKRKMDPSFLENKRNYAKKNYSYHRITVDCPACNMRHKADSQNCIIVREQAILKRAEDAKHLANLLISSDKKCTEQPKND